MKCLVCKEELRQWKEICFGCEGKGRDDRGKKCGMCDGTTEVGMFACMNRQCSFYDNGED